MCEKATSGSIKDSDQSARKSDKSQMDGKEKKNAKKEEEEKYKPEWSEYIFSFH